MGGERGEGREPKILRYIRRKIGQVPCLKTIAIAYTDRDKFEEITMSHGCLFPASLPRFGADVFGVGCAKRGRGR